MEAGMGGGHLIAKYPEQKAPALYGPMGPQQGRGGKARCQKAKLPPPTVPDNEVSVKVLGKCLTEAP